MRYRFFDEVCENYENPVIATAHNANDSVESMLMHLMRGSGLTGLVGIRPKTEKLIRPLIEAERSDIEKYCDNLGIIPRHDCTNDSDDYHRNDIRHNVLAPMLERCNILSICRMMNVLSEDECFLEKYTEDIKNKYVCEKEGHYVIKVKEFNLLPLAIRRRLLRLIIDDNPQNQLCLVHIDDIIAMAEKNYGGKRILLPGKKQVCLEKGEIVL